MGLLEQAKAKWQGLLDYIDANTPRHAGALPTVGRVVDQGLINPNRFNKPSADRFKESTFGLLGIVPGVGDYASVVESADLFNRGEKFAGGMAALGALPLVPAIGGMFIGKGAKTWDALKAQQADELLKQGIDPREVWKQTGTMRGVDGALRQEIQDNAAKQLKNAKSTGRHYLDDWIKHPELQEAYPKMFNHDFAGMSGDGGILAMATPNHRGGEFSMNNLVVAGDTKGLERKSITLHELQHAIQQREGWARGGSPEGMRQVLGNGELTGLYSPQELNDAYRRLAGEAEARLTQARMNMTMPERLQSYPYDMLDVPQDQLIVRGLLGEDMGPAMHTVYHGSPHKFNKFDMSKIGTGEGAQAYGHGLYFAENPGVAKSYQNMGPREWFMNGEKFDPTTLKGGDKQAWNTYLSVRAAGQDPMEYAAKLMDEGKLSLNQYSRISKYSQAELRDPTGGNLYKVDIPDEAIPRMLDWDKPLSEQADVYGLFNKPALSQAAGKVDSGNTNGTGYMPQGMPGSKQVNSHSNIPLNGVMGDGMRGMGNDFQIGNGVVGLDPVDVMNGLSGKQFAPNGISSSKPMDFPLLPADGGNGIPFSVNASGAPVGGVTRAALAENLSIGGDIVRMPENTLSAIRAGAFDKLSGHDVYSSISKELGSDKAASDFLAKYNINGIRYLDGSSRNAGQGTSNFVLFDDQLPRILEVNGQPTGLMSYADEAAQGGGLLGKVDNAGMSAWKQNDVFGNGKQIEHLSPDGKSAVVQQTLPNGKTVFYPADVDATYGWVRPDMYKRFDSFEAAQKSIKGMRISDAAKKRNTELYGNIPNTWKGDAKKVAKKLIDNGFDVSRFSSSTQSKSKYIELADGRKIRLSDHDLPLSYEGADFDFRYGGDISELIGKLK